MRIVVGGQIEKAKIAETLIAQLGDSADIKVLGDIEAAMAIKSGQADYYFG
ncbi:MAG: DUF2620 family protein, partial [Enterovibrio sp.]